MKAVVAFGFSLLCIAPALAASDDFDRATLGKKWVVVDGTLEIANDQMVGSDGGFGYLKKSANDATVTATVTLPTADLQYGAVVIGDIAGHNDAFVKIQNSGDTTFVNGAFYDSNNGNGNFFALSSPVPSPATLQASLCGSVVTMTIKSAAKTQKYSYDYGSEAESFGSGGGLGTYGPVELDNYKSGPSKKCGLDADTVMIKGPSGIDPTKLK